MTFPREKNVGTHPQQRTLPALKRSQQAPIMADPPTDEHTSSTKAAAAMPIIEAAECKGATTDATSDATNDAKLDEVLDSTDLTPTSQALVQLNAATSAMSLTDLKADPTSTTENSNDHGTIAGKIWPRLHLLGLARELRDQIWRRVVVEDGEFFIKLSFGRQGSFSNVPALIRVSRQVRHETRRMFLEENTIGFCAHEFLTCFSSKPMAAFGALCVGAELQRVEVSGEELRGPYTKYSDQIWIRYNFEVSKTKDGLKVEFTRLYMKDGGTVMRLKEDDPELCGCRIEGLASLYGQQDNAIVRFLKALREDYLLVSHNKCERNHDFEKEEHYGCGLDQEVEWCDIHSDLILC
jgi:hypothetical protein